MQLTRFTDYSLRVLIFIGLQEKATVAQIANSFNISRHHLVKIVTNLTKLNILIGTKGRSGGLSLALDPSEINIGLIVRELEKKSTIVECFSPKGKCVIKPSCLLKEILHNAQEKFFTHLEKFHLSDILLNSAQLSKNLKLN